MSDQNEIENEIIDPVENPVDVENPVVIVVDNPEPAPAPDNSQTAKTIDALIVSINNAVDSMQALRLEISTDKLSINETIMQRFASIEEKLDKLIDALATHEINEGDPVADKVEAITKRESRWITGKKKG